MYIDKILDIFVGDNTNPGILKLSTNLVSRKKSTIYNILGITLLKMHNKCLVLQERYKDAIKSFFNLGHDDIYLTEAIFDIVRSGSRNNDYSKVDSYDGLIVTYKIMISHSNDKEYISTLESRIRKLEQKRNLIRQALNIKESLFQILYSLNGVLDKYSYIPDIHKEIKRTK